MNKTIIDIVVENFRSLSYLFANNIIEYDGLDNVFHDYIVKTNNVILGQKLMTFEVELLSDNMCSVNDTQITLMPRIVDGYETISVRAINDFSIFGLEEMLVDKLNSITESHSISSGIFGLNENSRVVFAAELPVRELVNSMSSEDVCMDIAEFLTPAFGKAALLGCCQDLLQIPH